MTGLYDYNRAFVVVDGIENAVIALSNTEFVLAGQLFRAKGTWFAAEVLNPIRNLFSNLGG